MAACDSLEKLRAPSRAHALSDEELISLAANGHLQDIRLVFCKVGIELEEEMAASFQTQEMKKEFG